jgi:hypothetical protein
MLKQSLLRRPLAKTIAQVQSDILDLHGAGRSQDVSSSQSGPSKAQTSLEPTSTANPRQECASNGSQKLAIVNVINAISCRSIYEPNECNKTIICRSDYDTTLGREGLIRFTRRIVVLLSYCNTCWFFEIFVCFRLFYRRRDVRR